MTKLPEKYNPESYGIRSDLIGPSARKITIEEEILNQIAKINYLRSEGYDWTEALQALRGTIVGLEDDDFEDEWNSRPIAAYRTPEGLVYVPQPDDLAYALHIIMRLLARRNITYRYRRVSRTRDIQAKLVEMRNELRRADKKKAKASLKTVKNDSDESLFISG